MCVSEEKIRKIKQEFIINKDKIMNIINLEKEKWDYKIDYNKLLNIFEKYEIKNNPLSYTSDEIKTGIGKVAIINQYNPYSILTMCLVCIRTNNNATFFLSDKLLGINSIIVELSKKHVDNLNYINSNGYELFYQNQSNFDSVIYFGNKFEYIEFSKRLKIKSIFENSNEIFVYIDNRDFKEEFIDIDKFAYYNDINIRYYSDNYENSVNKINDFGIIKRAAIYTKDKNRAFDFLQKIKAEKVYVNTNPCKDIEYDFDENKVMYIKKIY